MLLQHAIFVDAGYLLTQALTIASSKASKLRKDLVLKDPQGLLAHLKAEALQFAPGTRMLRTYWYDGVAASMTTEQSQVAGLPDLHFRAGSLHNKKQKGVDGRIVQDLFELASERTISDALIITGDGDLSVGIEFAQRRGVRIAILGIEDLPNGVMPNRHPELTFLADAVFTMGGADINKFFAYQPPAAPAPPPAPAAAAPPALAPPPAPPVPVPAAIQITLKGVADTVIASVLPANVPATLNHAGGIVAETDRQLLAEARKALARTLSMEERNFLRAAYRARVANTPPAAAVP